MKTRRYFDECEINGVTVLRIRSATLGTTEAAGLYEDLLDVANSDRDVPDVIVNLRVTKFLSSDSLGAFLAIQPKLADRNGRVVLVSLQPIVRQMLELQRLHEVLNVFEAEDEAIAWCRNWRLHEDEGDPASPDSPD